MASPRSPACTESERDKLRAHYSSRPCNPPHIHIYYTPALWCFLRGAAPDAPFEGPQPNGPRSDSSRHDEPDGRRQKARRRLFVPSVPCRSLAEGAGQFVTDAPAPDCKMRPARQMSCGMEITPKALLCDLLSAILTYYGKFKRMFHIEYL